MAQELKKRDLVGIKNEVSQNNTSKRRRNNMASATTPSTIVNISGLSDDRKHPSGAIHTDDVYSALIKACESMEEKLAQSLKNYQEHPDVQANLQQLQYDLQQWNLALTTMTNIQKNMGDALASIASNFR